MDLVGWLWTLAVVTALPPFLDSVRLTRGASFTTHRTDWRLALLAVEVALVAAWALLRWGAHADRALAPADALGWARPLGLALTVAGLGLGTWAKIRLGRWFSGTFGVKPGHELVTDGPYAVTRHPLYTGIVTAFAGSALVWNSLLTMALAVVVILPLWVHTVIEERIFVAHFGDAYRRYRLRVPRLIPFAIRPREDA